MSSKISSLISTNGPTNAQQSNVPRTNASDLRRGNAKSAFQRRQGRWWLLTIPHHHFTPFLPDGCQYIKGQLERGEETGYLHWQILCTFPKKVSIRGVQSVFGEQMHAELTISQEGSQDYVWKDESCVHPSTRFELGQRKHRNNSRHDWEAIRTAAVQGDIEGISPEVYVRYYGSLQRIATAHLRPFAMQRCCLVFWGPTATGKTRTAWEITGPGAYPKSPDEKWFDAYTDQQDIIVDEYRGGMPISLFLQVCDRYPVLVPTKGSHRSLCARRIIFTSNVHPQFWYPDIDPATQDALLRRLRIYEFPLAEGVVIDSDLLPV